MDAITPEWECGELQKRRGLRTGPWDSPTLKCWRDEEEPAKKTERE